MSTKYTVVPSADILTTSMEDASLVVRALQVNLEAALEAKDPKAILAYTASLSALTAGLDAIGTVHRFLDSAADILTAFEESVGLGQEG